MSGNHVIGMLGKSDRNTHLNEARMAKSVEFATLAAKNALGGRYGNLPRMSSITLRLQLL